MYWDIDRHLSLFGYMDNFLLGRSVKKLGQEKM